MLKSLGPPA